MKSANYLQSLTQPQLAELLLPLSRSPSQANYRAKQIFHWIYQRFVTDWDLMTDLAKDLRTWLKDHLPIYQITSRHIQQATDGTHKFLWTLCDGKTIESVIIPAALQERSFEKKDFQTSGLENDQPLQSETWSRLTACISSQVGCAMACKFCLTGIQGLDRSLQTHEIVAQIFELRKRAPITNIVFMGMGEPLHNFDNVVQACKIFLDSDAFGFSKRKITLSTSGLVPAIQKLGEQLDISLAVSLNASTNEQRDQIMPVNKKWNIEQLMQACKNFPLGKHRHITFEYVLLKDFNDSLEDAARVARLVQSIPCKINLIPFNEHSGAPFKRPSDPTIFAFQRYLTEKNLTTTIRISRGRDILAACGQLRSIFGTARGTEKHKDYNTSNTVSVSHFTTT